MLAHYKYELLAAYRLLQAFDRNNGIGVCNCNFSGISVYVHCRCWFVVCLYHTSAQKAIVCIQRQQCVKRHTTVIHYIYTSLCMMALYSHWNPGSHWGRPHETRQASCRLTVSELQETCWQQRGDLTKRPSTQILHFEPPIDNSRTLTHRLFWEKIVYGRFTADSNGDKCTANRTAASAI